MQISSLTKKKWFAPVMIIGGLVLVMVMSNRDVATPEGLKVIDQPEDYQAAMLQALEMTDPLFGKADRGEDLTEQDKKKLLEAAVLLDSTNRFQPDKPFGFLGAGKCYMWADDLTSAEVRLRQAIYNSQIDKEPHSAEAGIEAHYRLSQVRFLVGDYLSALEDADFIIKQNPGDPNYFAQRASVLVQLKKYDAADKDIHKGLELDGLNEKLTQLHKLLAAEDPKKFGPSGTSERPSIKVK